MREHRFWTTKEILYQSIHAKIHFSKKYNFDKYKLINLIK